MRQFWFAWDFSPDVRAVGGLGVAVAAGAMTFWLKGRGAGGTVVAALAAVALVALALPVKLAILVSGG